MTILLQFDGAVRLVKGVVVTEQLDHFKRSTHDCHLLYVTWFREREHVQIAHVRILFLIVVVEDRDFPFRVLVYSVKLYLVRFVTSENALSDLLVIIDARAPHTFVTQFLTFAEVDVQIGRIVMEHVQILFSRGVLLVHFLYITRCFVAL